MKKYMGGLGAVMVLCTAAQLPAAEPTDMDGAKTPAGKVVMQYLEYSWSKNKKPEAAKKLEHPKMIEHGYLGSMPNSGGPQGAPGGAPQGGPPPQGAPAGAPPGGQQAGGPPGGGDGGSTITPVKVIAQGDLVFVQGHGMRGKTGNGDLMWILYRVKDGKIIEHWDTHNEIPDNQVGKQW